MNYLVVKQPLAMAITSDSSRKRSLPEEDERERKMGPPTRQEGGWVLQMDEGHPGRNSCSYYRAYLG